MTQIFKVDSRGDNNASFGQGPADSRREVIQTSRSLNSSTLRTEDSAGYPNAGLRHQQLDTE